MQILACKPMSFTYCIIGLGQLISEYDDLGTQSFATLLCFNGSRYTNKGMSPLAVHEKSATKSQTTSFLKYPEPLKGKMTDM